MKRAVVLGLVVAGSGFGASPAAADLAVAGYGEIAFGRQKTVGGLANEFSDRDGRTRLAGGMRLGRFALGASVTGAMLVSDQEHRHGGVRPYISLGTDASVSLGDFAGLRPYVRVGVQRGWIGGAEVSRRCSDHSVCGVGFFVDERGYKGYGTSLAVGTEYLWVRPAQKGVLVALHAELALEHLRVRIRKDQVKGGFLGINVGVRVGGGRRSR